MNRFFSLIYVQIFFYWIIDDTQTKNEKVIIVFSNLFRSQFALKNSINMPRRVGKRDNGISATPLISKGSSFGTIRATRAHTEYRKKNHSSLNDAFA